MTSTDQQVDWADVLSKFENHDGTIASFCEKYKVMAHQLYYQRKKTEPIPTTFISVPLVEEENDIARFSSTIVEIAIGNATLKIPTANAGSLRLVLKTLLDVC